MSVLTSTTGRIIAVSAAVAIGGGVAMASPASAAPKSQGGYLTVTCDNGKTYDAVSPPANADFTPAIATDGTVLVPMAFGEVTQVLTKDGETIQSDTAEPVTRGATFRNPRATTECAFIGGGSFTDGGSVYVITFSGTATVLLAGQGG